MSSLAGALAEPIDSNLQDDYINDDVEMDQHETDAHDDQHTDGTGPQEDEEMGDDLFGENEDVDFVKHDHTKSARRAPETKSPTPASPPPDGLSSPDRRQRQALEYEEEEEPNEVIEQRLEAAVAIPNIPVPKSSDGQHWVIRMPNFVKVDSKPFHPDTYTGPEVEDPGNNEFDMGIKLTVENTVRWRWVKDDAGNDRRQSNARMVRWSDGSLSLRLGKEYFDVSQLIDDSGSTHRNAFGLSASQPLSQSQSQTQAPPASQGPSAKSRGLTYLVAQHKRAEILQAEAVVTGYMTLRPTDMASETHRLLVRAVGQKHTKVARLKFAPDPSMDPEREKQELMRLAARKPRRPRGEDDRGAATARRRRRAAAARRRSGEGMWSDDEDEEEGEDMWEEGGDEEDMGRSAKRRKEAALEARGRGEYQTDDFVVADSEEEVGGGDESDGSPRKRKRGREEPMDELDKMEKQISQQEEERRRQRRADGKDEDAEEPEEEEQDGEAEAEMDVESEEEQEVRQRRTTGGARKRRIDFDEEEED